MKKNLGSSISINIPMYFHFGNYKLISLYTYSGQTLKKLQENDRKGRNHVPDTLFSVKVEK